MAALAMRRAEGARLFNILKLGRDFLPPHGEAIGGGGCLLAGLPAWQTGGGRNYFEANKDTPLCRCRVWSCSPASKANLTLEKGGLLNTG